MDRPTILIIDDDVTILQLFSAALSKYCYPVATARTGELAMRLLDHEEPVLIIVDIAMPLVTGGDVIKYMKSDPRFDATKIIIMTAAPQRVSSDVAALANRVVPKPVTPKALAQIVFQLIDPCPDTKSEG